MTTDEIATRYWAAEVAGDLDGVLSCFNDDAEFATTRRTWTGVDEIRDRYRAAMDATRHLEVFRSSAIADGDRAAIRWAAIFTPETGAPFGLVGVNLISVRGGRFQRVEWPLRREPVGPGAAAIEVERRMNRIANVESGLFRVPPTVPWGDATHDVSALEFVVTTITTEAGVAGVGYA